jgi:serine protease Do
MESVATFTGLRTLPLISILLVGCAVNDYKKFYYPVNFPQEYKSNLVYLKANEEPQLIKGNYDDAQKQTLLAYTKGYSQIGYSSFNHVWKDESLAIKHAKNIGATKVWVASKYTDSQTTSTPLIIPTFGSIGNIQTTGTAVVPIQGTNRRYDQGAFYFVKDNNKVRFGYQARNLTPEERSSIGQNGGMYILAVKDGHPAFKGNLLVSDIIIKVDDYTVSTYENYHNEYKPNPDNLNSTITVIRNDEIVILKMTRNY